MEECSILLPHCIDDDYTMTPRQPLRRVFEQKCCIWRTGELGSESNAGTMNKGRQYLGIAESRYPEGEKEKKLKYIYFLSEILAYVIFFL